MVTDEPTPTFEIVSDDLRDNAVKRGGVRSPEWDAVRDGRTVRFPAGTKLSRINGRSQDFSDRYGLRLHSRQQPDGSIIVWAVQKDATA